METCQEKLERCVACRSQPDILIYKEIMNGKNREEVLYFIKGQFPFEGLLIMPDDIHGTIITNKFEISMIRSQPSVKDLFHFDSIVTYLDSSGSFFSPVP